MTLSIKLIANDLMWLVTFIVKDFSNIWTYEGRAYNVQLCFIIYGKIYMNLWSYHKLQLSPRLELVLLLCFACTNFVKLLEWDAKIKFTQCNLFIYAKLFMPNIKYDYFIYIWSKIIKHNWTLYVRPSYVHVLEKKNICY